MDEEKLAKQVLETLTSYYNFEERKKNAKKVFQDVFELEIEPVMIVRNNRVIATYKMPLNANKELSELAKQLTRNEEVFLMFSVTEINEEEKEAVEDELYSYPKISILGKEWHLVELKYPISIYELVMLLDKYVAKISLYPSELEENILDGLVEPAYEPL